MTYYASYEKRKEKYPKHRTKWTADEEEKVIDKIHELAEKRDECNIWSFINYLADEVGRSPGALRTHFGKGRLKMERCITYLENGNYAKFLMTMIPHSCRAQRREAGKIIYLREQLADQDLTPEVMEEELSGTNKYKPRWDPYKLIMEEQNE